MDLQQTDVAARSSAPPKTHQTDDARSLSAAGPGQARQLGVRSIYYLHPLAAGPLAEWPALLDFVAGLGFDTVLIGAPFAAASVLLPERFDRLHPALGWDADAQSGLAAIDAACRASGLAWMLDAVLDRAAAGGAIAREAPDLFAAPTHAIMDPRLGEPAASPRPEAAAALGAWWSDRLARWREAGAAGFRLLGLGHLPPGVLAALAPAGAAALAPVGAAAPLGSLIGWSEGIADAALAASLGGVGLQHTSLVLSRWDFAADWLWNRLAALRAIAPPVICVEAPFGPRLAAGIEDATLLPRALARAAATAVALSDAWLMPMGFEAGATAPLDPHRGSPLDREGRASAAEAVRRANAAPPGAGTMRPLAAPGIDAIAFAPAEPEADRLVLVNRDLARPRGVRLGALAAALGRASAEPALELAPGEVRALPLAPQRMIRRGRQARPVSAEAAAKSGRVALERIEPALEAGRFAVKRLVGDAIVVEADILCDGHDKLAAVLQYRPADEMTWRETRMAAAVNDRWQASFEADRPGRWVFRVMAWRDAFASFRDELAKKTAAGIDVRLEAMEGRHLVAEAASRLPAIASLADGLEARPLAEQVRLLLSPELAALMAEADERSLHTIGPAYPLDADRVQSAFAAWYEIFPRSMSDDTARHGTFRDVIRHLPRVRDMGFDVLYFPPIHPIGHTNRKGRNNALKAGPDDPGSPYAIGAEEGGHDALHPELGTLEDFRALVEAAAAHGLELAIDFAIQCSPDHPWLKQHKGWFAWRPDGSMRYAENPPKKYEDIVNVDFYAKSAIPGLWVALCDVVLFWAEQGVRVFRVDNPHTKPFPFWEWMINEVRAAYPDAIFLAEAFTRPKIMNRLAKLGFTQSYTYFTWRNTRRELQEYLTELSTSEQRDFFRPNFFVNTPDINPPFLQTGGRPAHLIRAALAATLSGLWGVYSGFELCEATPLPGREEYLDSEKYQLRAWDWDRPGNIVAEITRLNQLRRRNPALQTHLGVTFLPSDNDQVLFFEKATPDRGNVVLVAISLDPAAPQSAAVELPLWRWTLPDQASLACEDLVGGGGGFAFYGKWQRVTLTPEAPYAIWRARPAI